MSVAGAVGHLEPVFLVSLFMRERLALPFAKLGSVAPLGSVLT